MADPGRAMQRSSTRAVKLALCVLAIAFAVTHVIAIYTESINWDEFVLMQRAELTLASGQLRTGGRPGLGTLALVPIVHDCTSSIGAMHTARLAWSVVTFALLGGLLVFLLRATRRYPHPWHAAALGLALLALVPVFVRWSLHVRTDQPAIACVLWGGVALFASAHRARWAVLAGALFAVGYLFSQKALYIGALVGLVCAGDLYVAGRAELRRELVRIGAVIAGGLFVLASYRLVMPMFYATPAPVTIERGLSQFEFYRAALGFHVYRAMLPTLIPHLLLLGLLVVASWVALRRGSEHRRSLLLALAVATLGIVVGRFHAAAFPYFWMTLGIFFATSIAIGWAGICALWRPAAIPLALLVWGALAVNAVRTAVETLEDSQGVQRDTLAFVEDNFPPTVRSWDQHGALFCRDDPDPIPALLVESTRRRFARAGATDDFIREFRSRPIAIVLLSNRSSPFPADVIKFWTANYQPYYGSVHVAGRQFDGEAGTRHEFEIIVAGRYRWYTRDGAPARIRIDGKLLARGDTIDLAVGPHAAELVDELRDGMLVLATDTPPRLFDTPFYSTAAIQRWHAKHRKPPVYR